MILPRVKKLLILAIFVFLWITFFVVHHGNNKCGDEPESVINRKISFVAEDEDYSNIKERYTTKSTSLPKETPNPKDIKFILQWTSKDLAPFHFMGQGKSAFIKNKCEFQNCFVTDDRNLLKLTDFDAIVFNGRSLKNITGRDLPQVRSPEQKYIYGNMESAHNFPVCNPIFDNFFNWTWTYRLDSDFRWGYITIYDTNGTIIGPKYDMRWPVMDPIDDELKARLANKTKAAAWFVSHCKTKSNREGYIKKINEELNRRGWSVDIFGPCGKHNCSRKEFRKCHKMLETDYYFYLSFENSFAKDYVTEKLLTALNNYVVPVVYGAGNYSMFLPPGSYLDATSMGAYQLAETMDAIIGNKTRYHEFFRWRKHIKYKDTSANDDVCSLCAMLNDRRKMLEHKSYARFTKWWNGDLLQFSWLCD